MNPVERYKKVEDITEGLGENNDLQALPCI